jgi:hypothetical protein
MRTRAVLLYPSLQLGAPMPSLTRASALLPAVQCGRGHAFAPRFEPVTLGGKSLELENDLHPLPEIETQRLFASVPTQGASCGEYGSTGGFASLRLGRSAVDA